MGGLEEKAAFKKLMHVDIGWVGNTDQAAGDLVASLERSGSRTSDHPTAAPKWPVDTGLGGLERGRLRVGPSAGARRSVAFTAPRRGL